MPPYSDLAHGTYWAAVLCLGCPLAGLALAVWTAVRLTGQALRSLLGWVGIGPGGEEGGGGIRGGGGRRGADREGGGEEVELAVLVTGCGSGLGRELALELSCRWGFVVFAGCLDPADCGNLEDEGRERRRRIRATNGGSGSGTAAGAEGRIVALGMDVTSDGEVARAAGRVGDWLAAGSTRGQPRRHLHAVVNNAGIGLLGRTDWAGMGPFRACVEVNYLGMVRVTQALLPLLKGQATGGTYRHARIVVVASAAGLIATGDAAPYHGSKYAAEAFGTCLRHEMEPFGIQVATVSPSFHGTRMTDGLGPAVAAAARDLPEELREEYGDAFVRQMAGNAADMPRRVMWDAGVAVDALVGCVTGVRVEPRVVVGTDARFGVLLLRMLPVGLSDALLFAFAKSRRVRPAAMEGVGGATTKMKMKAG